MHRRFNARWRDLQMRSLSRARVLEAFVLDGLVNPGKEQRVPRHRGPFQNFQSIFATKANAVLEATRSLLTTQRTRAVRVAEIARTVEGGVAREHRSGRGRRRSRCHRHVRRGQRRLARRRKISVNRCIDVFRPHAHDSSSSVLRRNVSSSRSCPVESSVSHPSPEPMICWANSVFCSII